MLKKRNSSLAVFVLAFVAAGGCKKSPSVPAGEGPAAAQPAAAPSPGSGGSPASGSSGGSNARASSSSPSDVAGSLADRLKNLQSGGSGSDDTPSLPDWKPVSSATSKLQIPLIAGLVTDAAIYSVNGDVETMSTISKMDATSITIDIKNDHASKPGTPPRKPDTGTRILDVADVGSSSRLMDFFHVNQTEHFPGSLDRRISTDTLTRLRAGQQVDFQMQADTNPLDQLGAIMTGDMDKPATVVPWNNQTMNQCNLKRVEANDFSFPVLVNDEPTELPAIHVQCSLDNGKVNTFYFLDQPSNALLLASQLGGHANDRSQMIKISFSLNKPPTALEKKLADKEPVEVYGIYFDFGSSHIKPESEVVLKQIADVMQKNPTWKLNLSGHTDNIGDQAANLKLSQERAAAVKAALVTEYKIAPTRLDTDGFGSSRPIADNGKLDGRARNRRVELVRE